MNWRSPDWFPSQFPEELDYQGYCYQGEFLHIIQILPGITIQVLQDHLRGFLHECGTWRPGGLDVVRHPTYPSQIVRHPRSQGAFVITVHITNAVNTEFYNDFIEPHLSYGAIANVLKDVYHRQYLTPVRRIYRRLLGITFLDLQQHLAQSRAFAESQQPYTVTYDPNTPSGFVITVCLGNHVTLNEEVLDEALASLPPSPGSLFWKHMTPAVQEAITGTTPAYDKPTPHRPRAATSRAQAPTKPWHTTPTLRTLYDAAVLYCTQLYLGWKQIQDARPSATATAPDSTVDLQLEPFPPLAAQATSSPLDPLPSLNQQHPGYTSPLKKATQPNPTWHNLTVYHHRPRLWIQTTATPQVSLPGLLGMIVLLSTIMQYEQPRMNHTTRPLNPRSSVSYGLRWRLALLAKAIATAWDLVTQTHLELWGQGNDGILTMV